MKKLIGAGALLVALSVAALAQGSSWFWIIPETFLCVFGPTCPGTVQPLILDVAVPAEFQGQTMDVFATSQNGASVHIDNDAEIESCGSSIFIRNVEGQPNATTYQGEAPLTLCDTVNVYIHMGPDGKWSAELDMEFRPVQGGPTATPTNTPTATATQPGPTATATSTSTATPTATESPTVTATPPGPTPTPTNTPAPTSVDLSGMSGEVSNVPWWVTASLAVIAVGLLIRLVVIREPKR